MDIPHILVFYGSKRINTPSPMVASWLREKLTLETRATFSFVNLADLDLPLYDIEWPLGSDGPFPSTVHETWSREVSKADGIIVITNEYNHAISPMIKNAIDLLKKQWEKKPIGIMSYGGVLGGGRAAEQLRLVFAELYAMTIREQLCIPQIRSAQGTDGKLRDDAVIGNLGKFMDLLLWWTNILKRARAETSAA